MRGNVRESVRSAFGYSNEAKQETLGEKIAESPLQSVFDNVFAEHTNYIVWAKQNRLNFKKASPEMKKVEGAFTKLKLELATLMRALRVK